MRKEINELLKSELTSYNIAKATGISCSAISEIRSGKRKVDNLTLSTCEKLFDYYKKTLDQKEEIPNE